METDDQEVLKKISLKKTWLPILCGAVITLFLFYKSRKSISIETLKLLAHPDWIYLCLAFFAILFREVGHICRLRIISSSTLSWVSCFYIAILWEFSTAVTPSVVGGGIVAVFLFSKEGLSIGRSISYAIVNGIIDNLFFLLAGSSAFTGAYQPFFDMTGMSSSVKAIFFTNYTLLFVYTVIIAIGIFINPNLLKWFLIRITNIKFFKKWRGFADQLSKDIIVTSTEFKGKSSTFWFKVVVCTILTWIVRYAFLNCLIAAYNTSSLENYINIFIKQVIMWALMLVPLSPGGSGIAEVLFQQFFEPVLGDNTLLMALVWRICTYYLYLTLGILFLPKWVRRVYSR